LRVALEALSRLVLRLPPERAEAIFKQALNYYRIEVVAKHPWLEKSANHLLARSWEALPKHGVKDQGIYPRPGPRQIPTSPALRW